MIDDVGRMPEVALDRGPVGPRSIGDHDLDPPQPGVSLGRQKRRQGMEVALAHDPEDLAGLGVGDDGHVAVPAPERGLVDEQDSGTAASAAGTVAAPTTPSRGS